MKTLPLVLGGSVLLNAALALVLLRPSSVPLAPSSPHGDAVAAISEAADSASSAGSARTGDSADNTNAAGQTGGGEFWRRVETEALPDLVARLRREGCPTAILRAIVYARIDEQLRPRRREVMAELEEQRYWTTAAWVIDPNLMAAQREIWESRRDQMKALLGDDPTADDEFTRYYRQREYGNVSPDKGDLLRQINSDYSELRSQIYAEAGGLLMPEDRDKLTFLEKSLREDFAKMLTPEELQNYELRSSTTAHNLRHQLASFAPNEEEFRAVFQAARQVEEQFGVNPKTGARDELERRHAALLEAAKSSLSPARLAELSQATDPRYGALNRIATRYELPATVVPKIADLQQDYQKRAAAIGSDRALSASERAAQLTALSKEATSTIAPLLGTRGFEAYQLYGGGWIRNLIPPAPNPPSTPPTTVAPPTATTTGTAPKG